MMAPVGARWVCLLCKERALGDPNAKERERFRMSSYVPNYRMLSIILTVLGSVVFFAFRIFLADGRAKILHQLDSTPPLQAAAPWASQDPVKWPVLVTSASATFKAPLFASSGQGFFVHNDDGALLGLTTVTLAPGAASAVEITPEVLANDLTAWTLGTKDSALTFTKTRPSGTKAFGEGVVVLAAPEGAKAPVQTLTVRTRPYRAGAPAFAVVRNPEGGQTVYRGSILDNGSADGSAEVAQLTIGGRQMTFERGDGSATRVHFDQALRVRDLRGAPLVDSDGLLMAILTAPQAEMEADAKTKTFFAFGMKALQETVNLPPSETRPIERRGPSKL